MAGKNGGARPGAGRKPKAEKYQSDCEKAEEQIRKRLPDVIDKLFELANGVTVQKTESDGTTNVYTERPDFKAASYLVDRIMGRPEATVKNKHEGKLTIVSRVKQIETLSDPVALGLLCEFDARISAAAGGDDSGEMGALEFGGEVDLPAPPGSFEPSPNGNGFGPH